jgi:hypothetical protein
MEDQLQVLLLVEMAVLEEVQEELEVQELEDLEIHHLYLHRKVITVNLKVLVYLKELKVEEQEQ